MKQFFLSIVCAAVLLSCNNEAAQKTDKDVIPTVLNDSSIYNSDSVLAAVGKANAVAVFESKKLFLQAVDLYHNKKDPNGSIPLFKQSIFYNPDVRAYFQLGNALGDALKTDEAVKALELCYRLEYDPYSSIDYAMAGAYAQANDTSNAHSYLAGAVEQGFYNKNRLLNDKRFEKFKELHWFQHLVLQMGDDKVMRERLYKAFVKSIPESVLPFSEEIDSLGTFNYKNYINYDFALFIPAMEEGVYSRDVSNDYCYVTNLKINDNIHILIYKSIEAIADTLNPVTTNMIAYDSLGNKMDELMLSCACSPLEKQFGKINEDKTINIQHFDVKWREEPTDAGYAGNEIVGQELKKEEFYKITEEGKFEVLENGGATTASSNR